MATQHPMGPPETATCVEAEPFALQVTDDSMEPEFQRGCIVIIDPTGRIRDGAFVLAELASGFVFRQLFLADGRAELRALNSAYPKVPIELEKSSIKGVVVQRAGTRRRYHKRYD